ncbi:MAG: isoaspartyl peptidase/L-asparaginase [Nitrospirota bacterium]|nr:isoaspartyl peptidase/L-asparaginase [Nitrospirota bacterium]
MIDFGVVVHGGAGTPEEYADGCRTACEAAFRMLENGTDSLDAAVEAARLLEDDERFNAGSGSALRIDGKTVEMDAAVMDSGGHIGIVINIRNQKNPVLVARAVIDTPHIALAGRGAEEFAARAGFGPYRHVSEQSLKRYEKMMGLVREGKAAQVNPLWKEVDSAFVRRFSCDTVGVVTLDRRGVFAVATSTGGAMPMLVGRVGDTPMPGCGFYAGASGAVAATGIGEEIVRHMLSRTVYDRIHQGMDLQRACEENISLFPRDITAGIIGISRNGYGIFANATMAHFAMVSGSDWRGGMLPGHEE